LNIRWPPAVDRPLIAAAAALWAGVVAAESIVAAVALFGTMTVVAFRLARPTAWITLVALLVGVGSGFLASERRAALEDTPVQPGRVEAVVEANTDVIEGDFGSAIVATAVDVSAGQLPRSPLIVSPSSKMIGLSVTELISVSTTSLAWPIASRVAPCTCGTQRSE